MELNEDHQGVRVLRQFQRPLKEGGHPLGFAGKFKPEIVQLVELIAPEATSAYYSPNTFKKHHAQKKSVCTVTSVFLDIDINTEEVAAVEHRINIVEEILKIAGLPIPTAIIDSGSGLHLYYIFDEHLFVNNPKIISLIERLQGVMIDLFNSAAKQFKDDIYADNSRKNINGLLRIPCSRNKGREVHCVQFNAGAFTDHQTLIDDLLPPYDPTKVEKAAYARKQAKAGKNIKQISNLNTLNVARVNDLLKLLKLRNYDLPNLRNTFLHILASQLVHHATNNKLEMLSEANDSLLRPLNQKKVNIIWTSAQRGEYLYKNRTIIEKLHITSVELKNLNQLTPLTQKEKRQLKKEEKKARKQLVITLIQAEKTNNEIVEKTGVSKRTIQRIRKEIII